MEVRRASAGSLQSIVIVLVLVGVLYLFLSGKGKGKRSGSGSSDSEEGLGGARERERGRDSNTKRRERSKRDHGEAPSDDGKSDRRKRRDEEKRKKEEEQAKKKAERERRKAEREQKKAQSQAPVSGDPNISDVPGKWAAPPSGQAPPLRVPPDHRSASPTKGIFRARSPEDELPPSPNTAKGNRIRWVDVEGKNDDVVTGHFKKWGDHTGLEDQSEQAFVHRPSNRQEGPSKGITEDPIRFSVDRLAAHAQNMVPPDLLRDMQDAERVGRAKPSDGQVWGAALQDAWDQHLGPVPQVAQVMAQKIASYISKEELRAFQVVMKQRQKAQAKWDAKRDFNKFCKALGVPPEHPEFIYKLVLGWYLDTLRCKAYIKRMQIHDEPVKMTSDEKVGPMSQMLGWMEFFGKLTKGQRLFVGLDLYGLAMRAQAMRESEGYRLDLTVFLPGGPVEEKKDPDTLWYMRLNESCEAFRNFHVEVARTFDNTTDDGNFNDPFTRRRLIFRPGWTVRGVDIDRLDDPAPERSVAQKQLLARRPKALELPENMDQLVHKALRLAPQSRVVRKVMSGLAAGEVCFQHIRQYAWDNASLNKDNSTFSPTTFWVAWEMCGEDLINKLVEVEEKTPEESVGPLASLDFVRSLDLGGNVPIHLLQPPKFLKIESFPALEVLVLAYIPIGQLGGTADMMLRPEWGLRAELERHREQTRHLYKRPPKLKLFVSMPDLRTLEFLQADLNRFFAGSARRWADEGLSKAQIRSNITGTAVRVLENVYVVDESRAGTVGEGKSTTAQGIRLNFTPTFENWLLEEDDEVGGGRPPPQSPFGSMPPVAGGGGMSPSGAGGIPPIPPAAAPLTPTRTQEGTSQPAPGTPVNLNRTVHPGGQGQGKTPVSPAGRPRPPPLNIPPPSPSPGGPGPVSPGGASAGPSSAGSGKSITIIPSASEDRPYSGNPLARHAPDPRYPSQGTRSYKSPQFTAADKAQAAQAKANHEAAQAHKEEMEQEARRQTRRSQRAQAQAQAQAQTQPTAQSPDDEPLPTGRFAQMGQNIDNRFNGGGGGR